jgi:ferredoxin
MNSDYFPIILNGMISLVEMGCVLCEVQIEILYNSLGISVCPMQVTRPHIEVPHTATRWQEMPVYGSQSYRCTHDI